VVDRGVIVLVDVVMRAMIEDAADLSGPVVMRYVIVVVHVSHRGVDVFVLSVANDALLGLGLVRFLCHVAYLQETQPCSADANAALAPRRTTIGLVRPAPSFAWEVTEHA